ncbi:hypothetical protein GF385_00455 [Candidatus Dependentiae bacterium]|nr:hypothetical protein [Candidatus Dependentiae bacterium]
MKKIFLFILILNFLQELKSQEFCYEHETEICSYLEEKSFKLPKEIKQFAKKINASLNYSMFFDVPFLLNTKNIRKYLLKPKYYKSDIGKIINIETEDGNNVECIYFNRNSDKLIVIGGGFTNEKELMAPFVHIFDCDIILFDYRGHGIHNGKYYNPKTWRINPIHRMFNVNTRKTKLGNEEEKDVIAVVNQFRNIKNYKKVFGLGVCYSALIFIKSQSIWLEKTKTKLFDKIILDGCWLSLKKFIKKLSKDIKLLFSTQHGGWKNNWLNKKDWFQKTLIWIAQKIFTVKFDSVSILEYLENIKDTPILYFYGKDDLLIKRKEFETIWNNLNTEKTAIITSKPHVRNHIKEKELYKLACNLFLKLPHKNFINCLKNKSFLVKHYTDELLNY